MILLSLNSCSTSKRAQRHLSRAIDHIDKAKKLDPSISLTRVDTIVKEVIREKSVIDTVFAEGKPGDTVVIENERVKVKYVRLPGDKVYVQGEAKQDTIYVKVPCEKEILIKRESYKDIVKRITGLGNFGFYVLHTIIGIGLLLGAYLKFKPF